MLYPAPVSSQLTAGVPSLCSIGDWFQFTAVHDERCPNGWNTSCKIIYAQIYSESVVFVQSFFFTGHLIYLLDFEMSSTIERNDSYFLDCFIIQSYWKWNGDRFYIRMYCHKSPTHGNPEFSVFNRNRIRWEDQIEKSAFFPIMRDPDISAAVVSIPALFQKRKEWAETAVCYP